MVLHGSQAALLVHLPPLGLTGGGAWVCATFGMFKGLLCGSPIGLCSPLPVAIKAR